MHDDFVANSFPDNMKDDRHRQDGPYKCGLCIGMCFSLSVITWHMRSVINFQFNRQFLNFWNISTPGERSIQNPKPVQRERGGLRQGIWNIKTRSRTSSLQKEINFKSILIVWHDPLMFKIQHTGVVCACIVWRSWNRELIGFFYIIIPAWYARALYDVLEIVN
jgi:hypothetical protein